MIEALIVLAVNDKTVPIECRLSEISQCRVGITQFYIKRLNAVGLLYFACIADPRSEVCIGRILKTRVVEHRYSPRK